MEITLPKHSIDSVNTVVVLKLEEPVVAGDIRLLHSDDKNQLLAFDATLSGDGLKFGGGQSKSYYVYNWLNKIQNLSWDIRLNKSAVFDVTIKYETSAKSGGTFNLAVNDQILKGTVKPTENGNKTIEIKLGQIQLKEGVQKLSISPENITGDELMKIFEINLVPVNR